MGRIHQKEGIFGVVTIDNLKGSLNKDIFFVGGLARNTFIRLPAIEENVAVLVDFLTSQIGESVGTVVHLCV